MVASINILVITVTWGLNCEGVKDLAGPKMVVFSCEGDLEENGTFTEVGQQEKKLSV